MQFQLSKYANISVSESSLMPYLDLELYHGLLVKYKKEEKEVT